MYSDEEAYEVMRQFVSDGKYKKAYEFCTTYRCKGNALKTSLECAKDILGFVTENARFKTLFHWDDNYKDGLADIHSVMQDNLLDNILAYRINELRTMFRVNQK